MGRPLRESEAKGAPNAALAALLSWTEGAGGASERGGNAVSHTVLEKHFLRKSRV